MFLKHLLVTTQMSYASATQQNPSCTVQYFDGKLVIPSKISNQSFKM